MPISKTVPLLVVAFSAITGFFHQVQAQPPEPKPSAQEMKKEQDQQDLQITFEAGLLKAFEGYKVYRARGNDSNEATDKVVHVLLRDFEANVQQTLKDNEIKIHPDFYSAGAVAALLVNQAKLWPDQITPMPDTAEEWKQKVFGDPIFSDDSKTALYNLFVLETKAVAIAVETKQLSPEDALKTAFGTSGEILADPQKIKELKRDDQFVYIEAMKWPNARLVHSGFVSAYSNILIPPAAAQNAAPSKGGQGAPEPK